MNRMWSLLSPVATGRRRTRGVVVLLLAALVPLVLLLTLVPARDQDDAIPAALVNLDTPISQTVGDTEVPVAAGKLLTENLVNDARGMAWTLTDPDTARAGLEDGRFLAVVTIPSDFSEAASSLASGEPDQAALDVQTSTEHGYLVGAIADALTANLPQGVSAQLTAQYLDGTLSAFGQLHTGIGEAASAAAQIGDATSQAAEGARQLSAATEQLTDGLGQITGVLSALPRGAQDLGALTAAGAADAGALSLGLAGRAWQSEEALALQRATIAGTDDLLAWIEANPGASAADVAAQLETLRALSAEVETRLAGQGEALVGDAANAAVLAVGAGTIAAVSAPVADALGQLAAAAGAATGGSGQLAAAEAELAGGLDQLADGSSQLGAALAEVSAGIPDYSEDERSHIASVVSEPITVAHTSVAGPTGAWSSALATVAPIGLWLGAFVLFLVLAPFARSALTTPASAWRVAGDGAGIALVLALVQGIAVWGVLALGGAAPDRMGIALVFVLAASVCFALVHQALVAAFGRAGLIVSAVFLGLQLLAAGTLTPAALTPAADTPLTLLPLSLALQGAQALLSGSAAAVASATFGIGLWALAAFLGTVVAISARRRRVTRALATA